MNKMALKLKSHHNETMFKLWYIIILIYQEALDRNNNEVNSEGDNIYSWEKGHMSEFCVVAVGFCDVWRWWSVNHLHNYADTVIITAPQWRGGQRDGMETKLGRRLLGIWLASVGVCRGQSVVGGKYG